jgi:hypothetical protein
MQVRRTRDHLIAFLSARSVCIQLGRRPTLLRALHRLYRLYAGTGIRTQRCVGTWLGVGRSARLPPATSRISNGGAAPLSLACLTSAGPGEGDGAGADHNLWFRPFNPRRIAAGTVIKPIGARAVGKVVNDDRADWREAWALSLANHLGQKQLRDRPRPLPLQARAVLVRLIAISNASSTSSVRR